MKNLKTNVFIIIVSALLNCSSAFAWDDESTHPALTDSAIKHLKDIGWLEPYFQNNLGLKDHVEEVIQGKSIKDLLLEGSREEDSWPDRDDIDTNRSINHFHSPIDNMGLNGEQYIYIFGIRKYIELNGESALGWARGDVSINKNTWKQARGYSHYALAF